MRTTLHPGETREGMKNVLAAQEKNLNTVMEDSRGLIFRKHTELLWVAGIEEIFWGQCKYLKTPRSNTN